MESWFLSDYEGEYCRKSRHLLFLISWTRKQYVVSCTEFIVPFYFHVLGGRWWNLLGMSRNKYASHPIYSYKVKVKCTLVQALRLCIGSTAHRGSRGIALLFHVHGTRRGWGVSAEIDNFFFSQNIVNVIRSRIAGGEGWRMRSDGKLCTENLKREIVM